MSAITDIQPIFPPLHDEPEIARSGLSKKQIATLAITFLTVISIIGCAPGANAQTGNTDGGAPTDSPTTTLVPSPTETEAPTATPEAVKKLTVRELSQDEIIDVPGATRHDSSLTVSDFKNANLENPLAADMELVTADGQVQSQIQFWNDKTQILAFVPRVVEEGDTQLGGNIQFNKSNQLLEWRRSDGVLDAVGNISVNNTIADAISIVLVRDRSTGETKFARLDGNSVVIGQFEQPWRKVPSEVTNAFLNLGQKGGVANGRIMGTDANGEIVQSFTTEIIVNVDGTNADESQQIETPAATIEPPTPEATAGPTDAPTRVEVTAVPTEIPATDVPPTEAPPEPTVAPTQKPTRLPTTSPSNGNPTAVSNNEATGWTTADHKPAKWGLISEWDVAGQAGRKEAEIFAQYISTDIGADGLYVANFNAGGGKIVRLALGPKDDTVFMQSIRKGTELPQNGESAGDPTPIGTSVENSGTLFNPGKSYALIVETANLDDLSGLNSPNCDTVLLCKHYKAIVGLTSANAEIVADLKSGNPVPSNLIGALYQVYALQ